MTSDNPIEKDSETKRSDRPADERSSQSKPQASPTSGSAKSQSPPSPESDKIPCHTHRDWHDYTMLIVQGVGVVFLIAYTTFAALQWREMKKTADEARRATGLAQDTLTVTQNQFRKDQRPYVWVANNDLVLQRMDFLRTKTSERFHTLVVSVTFTNFGKSPAILLRHYHGLSLTDEATALPWIEDGRPLPPGKLDTFSPTSKSLTDKEISAYQVIPYTGKVMVFATWQYLDSVGHKYETEFCMSRLNLGAWAYCKEHNGIKDCAENTCEP